MIRGEFSLIDKNFDIEKCKLAAEKGNPEAQESLAYCYYLGGRGIGKDENKAFQLALKSAKQELPEGLDLLGDCYRFGKGTEINEKKAFECYEKAAKEDYTNAIGDLGECYLKGIGVEQDEEKGLDLLEEAADRDFDPAVKNLADYYLDKGNEEKAFALYKRGAKLENDDSQVMLGLCYLQGIGTSKDEHKAYKLIQEIAVKYDNGEALYWMGWFYANGVVVGKDPETAEMYYQKALENGYVEPRSEIKLLKDYYSKDSLDILEDNDNYSKTAINYTSDKDKIQSCVVYIEKHSKEGIFSGSGFIINSNGYVATNAHVVIDAEELYIKFTNENKEKKVFKGTVIKLSEETDTAVIKIESTIKFPFIELDDPKEPNIEDEVVLYGYPLGDDLNDDILDLNVSFNKGYVSSIQVKDGIKQIMLDIAATHGNSGGPVISCKTGKVEGLLTGGIREIVPYVVPICYLHDLLNEIAEEEKAEADESESPKEVPRPDTRTNMTWADVKRLLRKEYKVATEENDFLAFDFELENNRAQRVCVERAETKDGEQWINISSCIGLIDNSELNEVLELLDGKCWGGLIKSGDKHFVRHSLLLATASNSTLIYPISTLAQLADEIEEKYTGGDQY